MMGIAGSFGSVTLSLMTIAVAVIGYRMLMGEMPALRDAIVILAKLGIVMMLVSSWPAFRTLVANVALAGPAEVAGAVGPPAGLSAASNGLASRLDTVANRLEQVSLALVATTPPSAAPAAQPRSANAGAPAISPQVAQATPIAASETPGALMIRQTRVVFLVGAVVGLAAVHFIAGLLTAVAPFVAALLLFDTTRGLVEGLLRALGSGIVAGAGIALALAIEVALISTRLEDAIALAEASEPIDTVAIELLALVILFVVLQIGIATISPIVVSRIRLPRSRTKSVSMNPQIDSNTGLPPAPAQIIPSRIQAPPTRAQAIADSVASLRRREIASGLAAHSAGTALRIQFTTPSLAPSADRIAVASRASGSRSTARRASTSADKRDRRG